MQYLTGKEVAISIKEKVKAIVDTLERKPHLTILLNEEDKSSEKYVSSIVKNGTELGIEVEVMSMKQDAALYVQRIWSLNSDKNVDAVLITRPLAKGLDENKIISLLSPSKDVDAMNPITLGLIASNKEGLVPNTPLAMIKMLEHYNIEVTGKKVLVVGRSVSVGKPMALLLMNRNATVTVAHSRTTNLEEELGNYDIVVAALGKPHFLKGSKMKEGAIVIDAGIHYLETGIVGDVEPDEKLSLISKVPGGVGIITTACLLENVLMCYKLNQK